VAVGEKITSDRRQIITFWAEVVVDDVEKDRETAPVARLNEALEIVWPTVCRSGGVKEHTVIAPITASWKCGDRHQLDRCRPELGNVVKMMYCSSKVAGFGEGADVKLVQHDLFPAAASPAEIAPVIRSRIDHLARTVNAVGLVA